MFPEVGVERAHPTRSHLGLLKQCSRERRAGGRGGEDGEREREREGGVSEHSIEGRRERRSERRISEEKKEGNVWRGSWGSEKRRRGKERREAQQLTWL